MKIAIHHSENSFSTKWIEYCQIENIHFKIVDCYQNDIMKQLDDCDGLMWHFHQANSKDVLFAKQLLYSLQVAGKKVFPDFNTAWHFDDKVGQKYLLEAIGAPLIPTYVFYDKNEALKWIETTQFPKVFKLRKGAGSAHVQLVENKLSARSLIKKAFGKGFSQYNAKSNLKERWRKFKLNETSFKNVVKGIIRLGYTTEFDRVVGREKGYIYFQDYISGNDHDVRVVVIGNRAFAIKRMVRKDDFRASGSGLKSFNKDIFEEDIIELAFDITEKLNAQCIAFDFIYEGGEPKVIELSYGFTTQEVQGYWDRKLKWYEGNFIPQSWMVEKLVKEIKSEN